MLAKLPTLKEPGFVLKRLHSIRIHGEVEFWTDAEERTAYIVVNEVIFSIAPVSTLESLIESGRMPDSYAPLIDMLREQQRNERDPFTSHKLRWEALEMSMEEWEERVGHFQREREERKAESQRIDEEAQRRFEERERLSWEAAVSKVRTGDQISGEQLLFMARKLGIDVNPRTAGSLRKTIWISENKSFGPKSSSAARYDIYSAVRQALG